METRNEDKTASAAARSAAAAGIQGARQEPPAAVGDEGEDTGTWRLHPILWLLTSFSMHPALHLASIHEPNSILPLHHAPSLVARPIPWTLQSTAAAAAGQLPIYHAPAAPLPTATCFHCHDIRPDPACLHRCRAHLHELWLR